MAERAQDLADIRDRAVAVALGLPMPGVPDPGHPFVLAAEDLSPADTAGIDTTRVLALVTEGGGPTSHTAIVARALGVPCVVACGGVMAVPDGTVVAVDAEAGLVEVGVDDDRQAELRQRSQLVEAELSAAAGPGRTRDGHPVALLRNIGGAADLDGRGRRPRGRRAVPHRVPLPRPHRAAVVRRAAVRLRRGAGRRPGPQGGGAHPRRGRRQAAPLPGHGRRAQPGARRPGPAARPPPPRGRRRAARRAGGRGRRRRGRRRCG